MEVGDQSVWKLIGLIAISKDSIRRRKTKQGPNSTNTSIISSNLIYPNLTEIMVRCHREILFRPKLRFINMNLFIQLKRMIEI